jgi:hypothetical protein
MTYDYLGQIAKIELLLKQAIDLHDELCSKVDSNLDTPAGWEASYSLSKINGGIRQNLELALDHYDQVEKKTMEALG